MRAVQNILGIIVIALGILMGCISGYLIALGDIAKALNGLDAPLYNKVLAAAPWPMLVPRTTWTTTLLALAAVILVLTWAYYRVEISSSRA